MAHHMQSLQPIPVEVQQLAEIHSLGAPTTSYSQKSVDFLLYPSLLSLIALGFMALFILFLSSVDTTAQQCLPLFFLILSVVFGWMSIYRYLTGRKQQVHIYTQGFVYLRWHKAEALRWDQIETLWCAMPDSASYIWDTLRIRTTDGIKVWVIVAATVLRDSSELYRTIEHEFVRIRLPGVIEQYEAGHSIAFDNLSVDKLGLTYQGETLPWSQVQSIDVGDQRVWINKEGQKWGYWFNNSVPNLCLLRDLVTHIRGAS